MLVSVLSVVNDPLFRHTIRIDPIPAFRDAAIVGHPLVSIDADGMVRRTRLLAPDMPSFALQVVPALSGESGGGNDGGDLKRKRFSQRRFIAGGADQLSGTAEDDQNRFVLSGSRIMSGCCRPEIFAGKIVLVGRLLEAIPEPHRLSGDTFLTPFSWMAGSPFAGRRDSGQYHQQYSRRAVRPRTRSGSAGGSCSLALMLAASLLRRMAQAGRRPDCDDGAGPACYWRWLTWLFAKWIFGFPFLRDHRRLVLVYGGHLLVRALMAERERRRLLEEVNRDLESQIAERTQELVHRPSGTERAPSAARKRPIRNWRALRNNSFTRKKWPRWVCWWPASPTN